MDAPLNATELRTVRAAEILERIGTPEANAVLEELARGPSALPAREAQAALARLAARRPGARPAGPSPFDLLEARLRRELEQLRPASTVERLPAAGRFRLERAGVPESHDCCLALSPDGKLLATTGLDDSVHLWDAASGREIGRLKDPGCWRFAFSPDGTVLASIGFDRPLRLWDVSRGRELRHFEVDSNGFGFSPDGRALTSASFDRVIRQWDLASGKELRRFKRATHGPINQQGRYGNVHSAFFGPDGKTLATIDPVGDVRVWDLARAKLLYSDPIATGARCLAYSPDGKTLALGVESGILQAINLANRRAVYYRQMGEAVRALAYAADGKTLISGYESGRVRLWDAASGKLRAELAGLRVAVVSVSASADGRVVAAGSKDGTALVWETSKR